MDHTMLPDTSEQTLPGVLVLDIPTLLGMKAARVNLSSLVIYPDGLPVCIQSPSK